MTEAVTEETAFYGRRHGKRNACVPASGFNQSVSWLDEPCFLSFRYHADCRPAYHNSHDKDSRDSLWGNPIRERTLLEGKFNA